MMNITPESVFSALANSMRLRCVLLLQKNGELCVCELTQSMDVAQPNMSRNLALLREAELVSDRRDGQWIYYRINPDLPDWVQSILEITASASEKIDLYHTDQNNLAAILKTSSGKRCA
ncbi:MAG: metalloregulator ArsR/SmtB family transcription factor [Candidatus Thiodiazotropha sp.]